MEQGILDALPGTEVIKLPIADGGEGTVEALVHATNGTLCEADVLNPLGTAVKAFYGILGDGKTAVIEMASASGLPLVPLEDRNPLITTTYGTGQLILAALNQGCREFILGIGGSATNDGGVGMAQALGANFYDEMGKQVSYGGGFLLSIAKIDLSGLDPRIAESKWTVACDVINPLCGPEGASAIFGPQKGATPVMVEFLDRGLSHLADLIQAALGLDVRNIPGAGAAGGLGAGMLAFLRAEMQPGVKLILEASGFEKQVQYVDAVITGEGRTDGQTLFGKAPMGVSTIAKRYGKPVICISGAITPDAYRLYEHGMDVIVGATQAPMTLDEALARTQDSVRQATSSVFRAISVGISHRCGEGKL
jgi:glycerate kinase